MRKFPLFLALAAMALALQTGWAGEGRDDEDTFEPTGPVACWEGDWEGRCGSRGFLREGFRGRGPGRHDSGRGGRRSPGWRHHGPGLMAPDLLDEMDFTAEQKTAMVDLMTENFRERLLARISLMEAKKSLRDLEEAESPDYDAIVQANAAVGEARGKMEVLSRKFEERLEEVLTPEQIEKLDTLRDGRFGPRGWSERPGFGRRSPRGDRGPASRPPRSERGPGPRVGR